MSMYERGEPYSYSIKEGDTVYICQCGHTGTPPFCDGTHQQYPDKEPYVYVTDKDENLFICGCGKSSNRPFCDGSHSC